MELDVWDQNKQTFYYRGVHYEMFTRAALAKALNRSVNTIRLMEHEGILCHPRVGNSRGWWLYTRSQIEELIKLAIEENVIDPKFHHQFSDRFVKQARRILRQFPDGSMRVKGAANG